MRITDLNREGGIGSNSLLVEIGKFKIVVDAGLHPKIAGPNAMPEFSRIKDLDIDCVIVTHCHLDHIGGLPVLLKQHPEAQVFMSNSSSMLLERMLHNSCNVMKRQKAEMNIEEYPLFTHEDVDDIGRRFQPIEYKHPLVLESGEEKLELVFHCAGHVAGAIGFELKHQERAVFFTGDTLFTPQRILPGAKFPARVEFDTIVTETTRGETETNPDKTRKAEVDRLIESIGNTLERGGSVLIPVFALGRMQEILSIVNAARKAGKFLRTPVFGAGLGLDICNYFDQIAKRNGDITFTRKVIKELQLRRPPRKLVPGKESKEQGIYILSSGMLMGFTPSYMMAATLMHNPRNSIFFVGYCDPDTPGGKLLECGPGDTFTFDAIDYEAKIRCQIERFELSGHANREELLEFALQAKPKNVILTHGDQGARDWFKEELEYANPELNVIDPQPLKAYEI